MQRLTTSLRSIARSCSKWRDCQDRIAGRVESCQTFTALTGHGSFRCVMQPIMSSVQLEIVKALRSGERSRASNLLSEIGQGNRALTTHDFVHILEHCARSPDPLFVLETWRMMRVEEVDVDDKCYSLIIRALCRGGHLEQAFNLMTNLQRSHSFTPILPMFNDILRSCARSQSVNLANECLELMENQMVGKNEMTYMELLKLAVSQQNLSTVHAIWKEYMTYYTPSLISLQKFIWSFSWLGDLDAAYVSLQKMVSFTLRGGFSLSGNGEGNSRLDIPMPSSCKLDLEGFDQDKNISELSMSVGGEILETYVSKNEHHLLLCPGRNDFEGGGLKTLGRSHSQSVRKFLRWSFNAVIYACAQNSNCCLAERLIVQMQDLGLEPSSSTYDGLIKAVVAERGFRCGIKLLETMQQKKLKPHDSSLAIIAIGCSKALDLDLAETLLDQISRSPNARPFNFFLEACDTLDQPERAVRALAKMKEIKLQPDIRTYELLFSLFGNCNPPYEKGNMLSHIDVTKRINAIEMDMVKCGIQHSRTSMKNLLKGLGEEGMVKELMQYLHVAENQFSRGCSSLTTSTYNVVLHSLVVAKESRMALEIFKSMESCGFQPDAATYNIVIDCCSTIKSYKSACAIVSVMMRAGFYLQGVTYTALIKVLVRSGKIGEALKLLDRGIMEGIIQSDVVLYNTILEAARRKRRIDIIEHIIKRMNQNQIQPDPSTCSSVFSAYVEHDYINTAMEALQVLSMRMIYLEDSISEKERKELEEKYIFAEDSEAELRIIELFKDYKEHLGVALLQLRWCASLGFQISWFPSQSPWARRLASKV